MASNNIKGGGTQNAAPGSLLLAVHDFIARSPDELSLAKGDRIELIERYVGGGRRCDRLCSCI